jgi:hypothetical protein
MNFVKTYWPTALIFICGAVIILSLTCGAEKPLSTNLSRHNADIAKCDGEIEILSSQVDQVNHMINGKKEASITIERKIIAVPLPSPSIEDMADEEIASRFTRSGL